jgi:hypothetical protein
MFPLIKWNVIQMFISIARSTGSRSKRATDRGRVEGHPLFADREPAHWNKSPLRFPPGVTGGELVGDLFGI